VLAPEAARSHLSGKAPDFLAPRRGSWHGDYPDRRWPGRRVTGAAIGLMQVQ